MSCRAIVSCFLLLAFGQISWSQEKEVPDALRPWVNWATWNDGDPNTPKSFDDRKSIPFWPSKMRLKLTPSGGTWEGEVAVYAISWIALPGSNEHWPVSVTIDKEPAAVIEREGRPALRLEPGRHKIQGEFLWEKLPEKISVPQSFGIIELTVGENAVALPNWDARGDLWIQRVRSEEAGGDSLNAQVYRVIEDGIPLWLRTEIELTVSGKSREELLGTVLPDGWSLATLESPIPVAVDGKGNLKAQVRAGKWSIVLHAFRSTPVDAIGFQADARPIVQDELIAFKANPAMRLAELEGLTPIDIAQTTFPKKWRDLPVYRWKNNQGNQTFRITEKLRGMGTQQPAGLSVVRNFWLDDDGKTFTFRDQLQGSMQQHWRLDVAAGQELGAVRAGGEGQLITTSPESGAVGVEVRERNVNLEGIGRTPNDGNLSAIGWETDAESLSVTLSIPPGWRALAVFGADQVDGDWLTAWSLLDLFLLMIFAMTVGRLWGFGAGLIGLTAFVLTYHELGSPRFLWFFLLIPLALLRVVPEGGIRHFITAWKWLSIAALTVSLFPFITRQVNTALYPQLETPGIHYGPRIPWMPNTRSYSAEVFHESMAPLSSTPRAREKNLQLDPVAKIQTGPATPEWSWNLVRCHWSGPVAKDQRLRPILISLTQHRALTVIRVLMLILLLAILLGVPRWRVRLGARKGVVPIATGLLLGWMCFHPPHSHAQFPDAKMLEELRERLSPPEDVFPRAAEIARAQLKLDENRMTLVVEVHAAAAVAVPLPGQLPVWSPISVKLDEDGEGTDVLVCRRDGYLWATVPQGVHQLTVQGRIPDVTEWEWRFLLKPRRVEIDALGWNVTGVGPNGIPESQVFFAQQQKTAVDEAAYDQKDFNSIVLVDRRLEIGLEWKVRSSVKRLASSGKAVSLKVPLLPQESVLTPGLNIEDGQIEVRLPAGVAEYAWESSLPITEEIQLTAAKTNSWVERWRLVSSTVWNVSLTKLSPIFEQGDTTLVPTWHPWPGEEVLLSFQRPLAVTGETTTVQRVAQVVALGKRQRTMDLKLDVESSLGGDFPIELVEGTEVNGLRVDGREVPVRREGSKVIVPIHPGKQAIQMAWKSTKVLTTKTTLDSVKLPVAGANVTTTMTVPEDRWVLWTHGPLVGPAVRFWTVLVCALLIAVALGRLPYSPLGRREWLLLALGLTQVHVVLSLFVVLWLFALAWRGRRDGSKLANWQFNFQQLGLVLLTVIALVILVVIVGEGLLGNPRMFIRGNNSMEHHLHWLQPRSGSELSQPTVISVSVWYYRMLMLGWALWLASALLKWLKWGWTQFSHGGFWKGLTEWPASLNRSPPPDTKIVPQVPMPTFNNADVQQ